MEQCGEDWMDLAIPTEGSSAAKHVECASVCGLLRARTCSSQATPLLYVGEGAVAIRPKTGKVVTVLGSICTSYGRNWRYHSPSKVARLRRDRKRNLYSFRTQTSTSVWGNRLG